MDQRLNTFKIIAPPDTGMTPEELQDQYLFIYQDYLQSPQIVRHWVPDSVAIMNGGDYPLVIIKMAPAKDCPIPWPSADELVFQGNRILWPWDDEISYAQVKILRNGYLLIIHEL